MYVFLTIIVLLVAGLLFLLARARLVIQAARKRRVMGERLAAAAERAERTDRQRRETADSGAALTTLLPAIQSAKDGPRRVA
jgi:hypothetical protein